MSDNTNKKIRIIDFELGSVQVTENTDFRKMRKKLNKRIKKANDKKPSLSANRE